MGGDPCSPNTSNATLASLCSGKGTCVQVYGACSECTASDSVINGRASHKCCMRGRRKAGSWVTSALVGNKAREMIVSFIGEISPDRTRPIPSSTVPMSCISADGRVFGSPNCLIRLSSDRRQRRYLYSSINLPAEPPRPTASQNSRYSLTEGSRNSCGVSGPNAAVYTGSSWSYSSSTYRMMPFSSAANFHVRFPTILAIPAKPPLLNSAITSISET